MRTIARSQALSDKQAVALQLMSTTIEDSVSALLKRPAASVEGAIDTLVLQLVQQGLGRGSQVTISPLTYGTTRFSSVFGRTIAVDLGDALVQAHVKIKATKRLEVLVGTYAERGDTIWPKAKGSAVA